MSCTHLCFLYSLVPFLSELAVQGTADACLPETLRSRGVGQVLSMRDQMSRTVEQLVSGKARMDARHISCKSALCDGREAICCESGESLSVRDLDGRAGVS